MKTVIKIGVIIGGVYILKIVGNGLCGMVCAMEGLKHRYGEEKAKEILLEMMIEGYDSMHSAKKKKAE